MTDHAAIAGNYSDFKLVKSRSVAQVIIEVPIEQAEAFLKVFGVPQPGAERPVALALLNPEKPTEQPKPRQSWGSMKRSQQAGILCSRPDFQLWIGATDDERAAELVRQACMVESRTKLDASEKAAHRWDLLVSRYRQATGQEAARYD